MADGRLLQCALHCAPHKMLSNMWCSSSTFPVTSNSPLARSSCRRSSLGVYSRVWSILLGFRGIHLEQAFAGLLVISRFDEGYVLGLVSLRTWLHRFRIWSSPPPPPPPALLCSSLETLGRFVFCEDAKTVDYLNATWGVKWRWVERSSRQSTLSAIRAG